jgi:hypothetical protein
MGFLKAFDASALLSIDPELFGSELKDELLNAERPVEWLVAVGKSNGSTHPTT